LGYKKRPKETRNFLETNNYKNPLQILSAVPLKLRFYCATQALSSRMPLRSLHGKVLLASVLNQNCAFFLSAKELQTLQSHSMARTAPILTDSATSLRSFHRTLSVIAFPFDYTLFSVVCQGGFFRFFEICPEKSLQK